MSTCKALNRQDYRPLKQAATDVEQQQDDDVDSLGDENHPFRSARSDLDKSKNQEISTWKIAFNIITYLEGVGFLALPYSVKEGGITAVIGFAVFPFIMGYTANRLAECLDEEDGFGGKTRIRWTYQDIGKDCWSPLKPIIWVLINIALFTLTVSYIVLCGSLMSQQFPSLPITESQWACLGTLLVLPTVFFKQFSQIAWISLIGLIALIASASVALSYEFQDISRWDFQSLLFWDTRGVFVSLSIIILCYGCHGVCVSMAADVSDQSKFKKALIGSYLFSATFKTLFAISGFLTYAQGTSEVLLNNLPAGIPTKFIAMFFLFSVLLSFPIPVLVIVRNIEELSFYGKLENRAPKISFILLRIFVTLAVLAFAVLIPRFALVSAIVGSITFLFGLTFPGLVNLRLNYNKLSKLEIFLNVNLVIFGTIGTGFTLVTTIMSFF